MTSRGSVQTAQQCWILLFFKLVRCLSVWSLRSLTHYLRMYFIFYGSFKLCSCSTYLPKINSLNAPTSRVFLKYAGFFFHGRAMVLSIVISRTMYVRLYELQDFRNRLGSTLQRLHITSLTKVSSSFVCREGSCQPLNRYGSPVPLRFLEVLKWC